MLRRVLTGTILGLVLFVLGSAAMDQLLERQAGQYQSLIALFFPLGEKVDEIHLLLLQQQSILERSILASTPADSTSAGELEDASDRFGDALSACFAVCFALLEEPDRGLNPAIDDLLAELRPIHRAFQDHSREITILFDQLSGRSPGGAREPDILVEQSTSLQESVARFEELLGLRYEEALARASAVRSSVRRLFVALVGIAVLLGTLANIFFYRSLLPLKSMVAAVRNITRGHYEVRVSAEGGDEVAFLAGEFNAMAEALGEQREAIETSHAEKLRLERLVQQSEKLSAVGELSLGVAHEVRNPLSTIQMTLHALGKRQDLSRAESERVDLARREVERLEGLVSSLLEYGRPAAPRMVVVDVVALIERGIDLVEVERVRRGVEVTVEKAEPAPPEIEADDNQVTQILVNLLLNAIQASADGGGVRVKVRVDADVQAGEVVSIAVIDEGTGIDREELQRIFTPFFTTRRNGTGLGLPVARKIAEVHGGALSVDSTPGRGTTATITLPVRPIGPR